MVQAVTLELLSPALSSLGGEEREKSQRMRDGLLFSVQSARRRILPLLS